MGITEGAKGMTEGAEGGHHRGCKGHDRGRRGQQGAGRVAPPAGPCRVGEQPHAGRCPSGSSQQARLRPLGPGRGCVGSPPWAGVHGEPGAEPLAAAAPDHTPVHPGSPEGMQAGTTPQKYGVALMRTAQRLQNPRSQETWSVGVGRPLGGSGEALQRWGGPLWFWG